MEKSFIGMQTLKLTKIGKHRKNWIIDILYWLYLQVPCEL